MLETGILSEDDRVELIEGQVVRMAAAGSRHVACGRRVNGILFRELRGRAFVGVQDPLHLSDLTAPRPDLSLLRLRDDFYTRAHPTAPDVLLLVEIADTSLAYDRTVKLPLYARSAIPEVWLFDLAQSWIEVYREPSPAGYAGMRVLLPGNLLSPEAFPDLILEVGQLLG